MGGLLCCCYVGSCCICLAFVLLLCWIMLYLFGFCVVVMLDHVVFVRLLLCFFNVIHVICFGFCNHSCNIFGLLCCLYTDSCCFYF